MENIEFVDRFSATGTPRPDENSCDWCEGMGMSPCSKETLNTEACSTSHHKLIIAGQFEEENKPCEEDGWVFVLCPDCFGTRKKNTTAEEKLAQLTKIFKL